MKLTITFLLLFSISTFVKAQSTEMTTDSHKYGLIASLRAKEGKATELSNILLKASELVSEAPGCISYVISLDSEEANLIWITEVWLTKEDHDNSLKNPEVRALIGGAMPLLDGPPAKGKELKVLGGPGSER